MSSARWWLEKRSAAVFTKLRGGRSWGMVKRGTGRSMQPTSPTSLPSPISCIRWGTFTTPPRSWRRKIRGRSTFVPARRAGKGAYQTSSTNFGHGKLRIRCQRIKSCRTRIPRSIVQTTVTYLENNQSRMDYPAYRRQGLPVSSSMIESLIKEMNFRVKGTEKFWNRPDGAENILQIRAAALCDDDRLSQWIINRPGSYFYRSSTRRECPLATPA